MEIWTKAALTKSQLDDRLLRDVDGIELHLLEDFIGGYVSMSIEEILKYPIKSIHAPAPFYNLEDLVSGATGQSVILRMCQLAETIGHYQRHKVHIVMHTDRRMEDWCSDRGDIEVAAVVLNDLLNTCRHITFCIENTIPLNCTFDENDFYFSNNSLTTYVQLAKTLRKGLNTQRIGTCLDTSHIMTTKRVFDALLPLFDEKPTMDYSVEKAFKRNKGICKQLHLATIIGTGHNKGEHGAPFSKKLGTLDDLNLFLSLYDKYMPDIPLVLEVEEDNYDDCLNFIESRDNVEAYYANKN